MPFIIWGSRGITSTLGEGTFYCPQCDREESSYTHKSARPWFTLYFIPVFPIGSATPYVECRGCGGTFAESVLELRPPSEGERAAAAVYEQLRRGRSLKDATERLVSAGVSEDVARGLVEKLAEGDGTWECPKCGNRYLKPVKKCRECAGSPFQF